MSALSISFEDPAGDALPPTDGGKEAWLLLTGCFVINVLIWGFSFSFGVLQEYYSSHEPFVSRPSGIPAIGTTATGLMYLLMPAYFLVLQRWPILKAWSIWISVPLVAAALIGASFAQNVSHLIGFQGVLFAIGGNLMFTPTVTYLDEWFVKRKGLAIGIMWAGDGTGGVIMPLIMQTLLSRYGFRTALRCLACAMVLCMAPLLKFLKPRLPISPASAPRPVNVRFLKDTSFWVLQAFNIIQATGFFLPSNYLPTYAKSLGVSTQLGSLTLVCINLASVLGCIIVGALMDRVDVTSVVFTISMGATTAILAIWGVSTSLAPLYVFSLLYGLTAGAYSSSWTGMIKRVQATSGTADYNIVFGCLAAGRGVGSIISGPLSEALMVTSGALQEHGRLAYGSEFGSLIIFTGCTAFVGGLPWIAKWLGLI
ncbi:MFS general substrate transporter [Aureobasidium sp. EXF-8845]|nr:MFS general substrate transporter [Aureobasidium sp. EXF-8845]KAI4857632.1 MFS general substrate transporter [Aureobasidium sp. EXF-8846]